MESQDLQVTEPIVDNSYIDRLKEIYPDMKDISEMTLSEVVSEREKMSTLSDELMKKSQERTYPIQVGSHAMAGNLVKVLNENCDWTVSDAAVLVSMMNDFKDAKKNVDKEGNIQLRTATITSLYQYLLKMKGKGYSSAMNYLSTLSISSFFVCC
jgi:hypothetical protein